MDNWAIDQLGVFLGFDPETLKTQVLPYLYSFDTATSLSEHLQDMLGTNNDTLNFIHQFVQHRFPPQAATAAKARPTPPSTPPPKGSEAQHQKQQRQQQQQSNSNKTTHQFPSLPPNTSSTPTSWPSNMTVHMKNKDSENASTKAKNRKVLTVKSSNTPSNSSLVSDRLEKKKNNKKNDNMSLESALKELDINVKQGGKRKVCHCQATQHDLLTIAPNCLHCGKIICVMEGVGPCSFCGTPVLSKDQQVALIAEAKKKRSEQKQLQHQQLQQQRKAAKASVTSVGYASKVSGDIVSKFNFDQQVEDEQRQKAELHKDKLLEFQRTSAQRSTVIDQATDFTLPTDQSNPWLTAQERAMQIKKQQANMKRLNTSQQQQRRMVLTIDIGSKRAQVDQVVASSSEDEDEPEEHEQHNSNNKATISSGTFARNPLLKGLQGPQFLCPDKQKKKQKEPRKKASRLQFDDDNGL